MRDGIDYGAEPHNQSSGNLMRRAFKVHRDNKINYESIAKAGYAIMGLLFCNQ